MTDDNVDPKARIILQEILDLAVTGADVAAWLRKVPQHPEAIEANRLALRAPKVFQNRFRPVWAQHDGCTPPEWTLNRLHTARIWRTELSTTPPPGSLRYHSRWGPLH